MNRLVLIGNGFDMAHGLKTSYADFIDWYWDYRMHKFASENYLYESKDLLCSFKILHKHNGDRETWGTLAYANNYFNSIPALGKEYVGKDVIASIINDKEHFETKFSPLFERIIKGLESKTWGGIEQDYYDLLKEYAFRKSTVIPVDPPIKALNQQLRYLQQLLVAYLQEVTLEEPSKIKSIEDAIYAPIREEDLSIHGVECLKEHKDYWEKQKSDGPIEDKIDKFGLDYSRTMHGVQLWKEAPKFNTYPDAFYLPNNIMLLNFNYTTTVQHYITPRYQNQENHIHGVISDPQSIILGYGDELDDKFKELKAHKNNACLSHVKSIKYLEAPNYRQMLSFIESEPFQVLIMGHSCGNSDRTLLNTIFEHPNCVSIKPYYYITDKKKNTDNYIELVQHISRNFNDMKLMRDRVVNKTQCEPLVKE